ncbi:putative DNA circulation family protein （Mu-like prophage&|uniref:DNA circularization protein n=1 Tax=Magnetospirillum sp. XM-1 TaxID=1663591 RepID=UPI00073DEDA4|nr:DNA circularization N-terminal domain-containing protein [Magnetospirillum sp. XM-1]CUW41145.1 putative DNA circulation family protein \
MAAVIPPWRRSLLPSTFRGVAFEVEGRDLSGGRNSVTHEFPDSEEVYTEDLGRKAERWSVEAYVWGPDYLTRRESLKKALREAGSGEYVDHWGGRHWVVATAWTCREHRTKGGWADFRIELVEAGVVKAQVIAGDSRSVVFGRADDALDPLALDFENGFSVGGPSFLGDNALSLLSDVGGDMSALAATVGGVGSGPLGQFQRSMSSFTGGLSALVATPSTLAGRLQSLIRQLIRLGGGGRASYVTASGLYATTGGTWSAVAPITDNRVRQAANQQAILDLVAGTALVEQARASAEMDYPTIEEATAARAEITSRLDTRIRAARSNDTRMALRRLGGAVTRDITNRGADLSRLTDYTPGATLPALVVAHGLYGDATRSAEILARNPDLAHPLFVPGGHAIKVVANG